jgi:uncharacterized membrane protein
MKNLQTYAIGSLFIAAGTLHFVRSPMYEAIVPPGFGDPKTIVAISGAAEFLGGVGVFVPATRRFSGWGLIALLIAVFPANVYMAIDREKFAFIPAWGLYARLPLQFLMIWWIYRVCVAAQAETE